MEDIQQKLEKWGITVPEILLPRGVDLSQWAVIACDQFTQDRRYWTQVEEAAAGSPSTINLIFPEVFLEDNDRARTEGSHRIADIHRTMRRYLDSGIFAASRRGFVYLERDTPFNRGRRGLVVAVDLECYDWLPEARPLIRSTEGTVPERLPPRMDIRRNAPVEMPHILLLIDDEDDSLLSGLGERVKKSTPAYQGELMLNSGSISGWFLDKEDDWAFLADGLAKLSGKALTRCSEPFLFAVGDGNHSLASAKGIWEEYKKEHGKGGALPVHPCRYALVEIENIYDPAIQFEPIHRVVFGLGFDEVMRLLSGEGGDNIQDMEVVPVPAALITKKAARDIYRDIKQRHGTTDNKLLQWLNFIKENNAKTAEIAALPGFSSRIIASYEELARLVSEPVKGNRFGIVSGTRYALAETSASGIATASLQPLLDKAISKNSALSIDYIHGEDEVFRLSADSAVGILLPPVRKTGFFETIARTGPLPRKSFSLGEAVEKRFYVECRKLFG